MLSKIAISTFVFLSAIFSTTFADNYYTITYADDRNHEIQVGPLKEVWEQEDSGDALYDFKFLNKQENKTCYIFTGLLDETIDQSILSDAASDIQEELYGNYPTTYNHHLSCTSKLFFHSFDLNQKRSVGIVTFPIGQYLFGVVIETNNSETLVDDCNAMIDNVLVFTLNK